jgi:hypothetical protein
MEDAPRGGFRYLIRTADMPALAHKVSMRRYGRKGGEGESGEALPALPSEGLTEKAGEAVEVGIHPAERDELVRLRERALMLEQENSRLWRQIERLTETVSQLALPPAREVGPRERAVGEAETPTVIEVPLAAGGGEEGEKGKRSFWDWFFGRQSSGGEGWRKTDGG